jgi:hypothetical protein
MSRKHDTAEAYHERIVQRFYGESNTKSADGPTPVAVTDEWVWVDGFKATEENMMCRDQAYELGKTYTMPEDAKIVACKSGFHLCLKLEDVFKYYKIGKGHRYFAVRALVRKSDVEKYGVMDWYAIVVSNDSRDKLAAKSIEFVRELTPDEIFASTEIADYTIEEKEYALEHGIAHVVNERNIKNLIDLGYSPAFAQLICIDGLYKEAYAVGTQEGLSMDMKCAIIFMDYVKND